MFGDGNPRIRKVIDDRFGAYFQYMKKNWLIISHAYNMDGRAASQTITDKIPVLLSAGINIQVLSAKTGTKDSVVQHTQLFPWGPSAFRFDFRHYIGLRFGKRFFYRVLTGFLGLLLAPFIFLEKILIGFSSQWSWFMPATLVAIWRVLFGRVDLVYTTGGAWSAHLAGWIVKSLTKVTWIVEIHDPLVFSSDEHKKNIGSYRDLAMQEWLESKIASAADLIWWFTKGAYESACERHSRLIHHGFYVLPGVQAPMGDLGHYKKKSHLSFSHFGSLSDTRSLQPFLIALDRFFKKHPESMSHCYVDVYGSDLDHISRKYLESSDLKTVVRMHGRIEFDANSGISGRDQILKKMHESDVLLLMHGDSDWCSEYIPSKVYEYFYANRPVLAVTHLNLELNQMVLNRGGYVCKTTDMASIDMAIFQAYQDWCMSKEFRPSLDPINVDDCVQTILKKINFISYL